MPFNVPPDQQPEHNKKVKGSLELLNADVTDKLRQIELESADTIVEAYNQPISEAELTQVPPSDMVTVDPQMARRMEIDSLRMPDGAIYRNANELFSQPLNADRAKAVGLVDTEGNATPRGELFFNLKESGVFNEDGTINEKGQAYLLPEQEIRKPENLPAFKVLFDDGLTRPDGTFDDALEGTKEFVGKVAVGAFDMYRMGQKLTSPTAWLDVVRDNVYGKQTVAEQATSSLATLEQSVKNVVTTAGYLDILQGLTGDLLYKGIDAANDIQITKELSNAAEDNLYAARQRQYSAQQALQDVQVGEIAEAVFGIDNAAKAAQEFKQTLGAEKFNRTYSGSSAVTELFGNIENVIPASKAFTIAGSAPRASRAILKAQQTAGKMAQMDVALAQASETIEAGNSILRKEAIQVPLAQKLASDISARAAGNPELLARANQASEVSKRLTASADEVRATMPTAMRELEELTAKRNSLATRIPEVYSQKVMQTAELGRRIRSAPARTMSSILERTGETLTKVDDAVTGYLKDRGLDQAYNAALGASGVVGLAGNPVVGAIGITGAALKTGKFLSEYGKILRYVGKEMENARGQIPFWKRVAAHTAPGSLGRGIAHTFNMFELGGATSDIIRRAGRGVAAAYPSDLFFEWLSDGGDMRPQTMTQAAAESLVIGGSFAAGGGAFMGTKKRMRELSVGDEINFRQGLTDTKQKALYEALPPGVRRSISTYSIANPTLNYNFSDTANSQYLPSTNTAIININSTNPLKALVAHETLHHTLIKNNMEGGIAALFLGDIKTNAAGGLFRSKDGKLDPEFENFTNAYYKRLRDGGMTDAEIRTEYGLDKVAVEYFIEQHADQYAQMEATGELGAIAARGEVRKKLGSVLETILPKIPVLRDLHIKSGGMIDKDGAWVKGNGILGDDKIRQNPIANRIFREMNRRSSGMMPGQFEPLFSDKEGSGAPLLFDPTNEIDQELMHPFIKMDDNNKPILKDGKPVFIDKSVDIDRAMAGLTAVEAMRKRRESNYIPEKGEAYVDDDGELQPGWLSDAILTEMFAKHKFNNEQKRMIRQTNKLIKQGDGQRMVMINFPATTRLKSGKVVYAPQKAAIRDAVPVAMTISKDGNILYGLMSVTKLQENIKKRAQSKRGKQLYSGNIDLILRDTQAMMDFHKKGEDSINYFNEKYGVVEGDKRKKFINTMFGLLNKKEQAVLNPMLLEDGIKSKDNVYRTYRADRVSKAVPMAPEEYAAMPFSYEAVSQVRMPEAQRAMPEGVSPEDLNPVANKQEAQGLWADGKQMFAINEMDEKLIPITSKAMLDSYPADAIGWMEPQAQNRFMPEPVPVAKTSDEALQESDSGELKSTGVDVPESVDEQSVISNAIKVANSQSWRKGRDFKLELQRRVLDAAEKAGVKLSERSLESIEYLARIGLKDALIALEQNPNAIGWYDEKTKQALGVMSLMFPEIATDQNARFAFTWALAVTSNGLKVDKNFELAERVYREYRKSGQMPTDIKAGQAQQAINEGLGLFNQLTKEWGVDNTRQFMQTNFTVGEISRLNKDLSPGGEFSDTLVRGSSILGPKIGNGFFSNLYGLFDALTMDRWLVRTWGRWTGTLVELNPELTQNAKTRLEETRSKLTDSDKARMDEVIGRDISQMTTEELSVAIQKSSMKPKLRDEMNLTATGEEFRKAGNGLAKYLDGQKEAPANPAERNFIREIFGLMLDELRADPKYKDLTMADLQAVLWYAEKRLYETAKVKSDQDSIDASDADGYEDDEAPDYANAAIGVARNKGVSEKRINEVLTKIKNDRAAITRPTIEEGTEAPAKQQESAGGFTGKQKQQFKQYVSVSRVRRNRTGNEKALWSYQTRSGVDSGDTGVLKPKAKKNLGVKYISEWKPGRKLSNTFRNNGLPVVKFLELDPSDQVSAKKFADTIQQSKDESPHGAAVYVYPVEDYQGMKLFLSDSGKSGFAVKPDGDIVSVFSMEKGSGRSIMEAAISAGGKKLDAFDTILPEFYGTHGFVEAARIPWNDEFAPDGWDKNAFKKFNNGEPDVVMMVLDPSFEGEYQPRTDIYTTDYDQAVEMQNAMLKKAARSRPKKASADIQKPTATPNQSAPKKPARKSQAKGNASAIANAAKLK